MKIYIIGPVGSGKTTLSKKLSKKYKIKSYELDLLVYDDENNHRKRTDEEINSLFNKILKQKNWIIEDVGRKKFEKGKEESDKIYYLKISKLKGYQRVIKRWIRQKMKKESYNYPPTIKNLIYNLKITHNYFKKEKSRLKKLEKYKDKLMFLNRKQLKDI